MKMILLWINPETKVRSDTVIIPNSGKKWNIYHPQLHGWVCYDGLFTEKVGKVSHALSISGLWIYYAGDKKALISVK